MLQGKGLFPSSIWDLWWNRAAQGARLLINRSKVKNQEIQQDGLTETTSAILMVFDYTTTEKPPVFLCLPSPSTSSLSPLRRKRGQASLYQLKATLETTSIHQTLPIALKLSSPQEIKPQGEIQGSKPKRTRRSPAKIYEMLASAEALSARPLCSLLDCPTNSIINKSTQKPARAHSPER